MSWARLVRFVLLLIAVTLIALLAFTLLPQDKFLRYQALNDGQAPTAYWVYQRINRDPTPIDVAFVGTSRTAFSIHSGRLEERLAQSGVKAHVANLHIVKMGRNMQYAIAKELLTHRKVRVLVLEMDDEEVRTPHPDFIYLADAIDVVNAPLFINLRYFSDLARLPGRQLGLFADTVLQRRQWTTPDFVVPPYEGPHFDHAEYIVTLDGVRHDRDDRHTLAQMQALRKMEDENLTPRILPRSLDWLEYRVPRYYVEKIMTLAAERHTRVVLLYMPRFGAPQACGVCTGLYPDRDVFNPWARMQEPGLWQDGSHMNWDGAQRVTDYVAGELVSRHLADAGDGVRVAEGR